MKILQVTPFFPPSVGGISDHVYNIVKNLQMLGNEVTVLTPHNIFDRECVNEDPKVVNLPSVYLLPWPYSTLKNFSIPLDLGMKIDKIVKKGNFDIIHTHGQHYPTSWFAISSAKKYGTPCVLTIHTTFALNPKKLGGETRFERYFNRLIFSRLLNKSSGVIGLTENNVNYAKAYAKTGKQYFQISNGISNTSFNENRYKKYLFRESHSISKDTIIVLFCGRFEDVKGILEFAKASKQVAKDFQNVRTIMIGSGSLKEQILSIVGNESRINIIDWQSHEELIKYYIMSDIFVIPSKFEGLPIVLLEAMAASLHIMYTPVGSMPEVLEKYQKKTMIKNSTVDDIYNSIFKMLGSFDRRNILLEDSNDFSERYDWKNISKQIEFSFQQIVNKDTKK